ncbi:uncharacterized protein E0L32_001349 [Thyridium curvatum]|uniref:DNA 3'-5' helicase n=1 Tax=Thyridium curvatum TaxID=1093900 RepID=A0A507AKK2_9PEZI|nr:uncharacterized protein E0L32_001349 [Thyridium curvatum]TPX10152.1 hypothetical protein E0L32_001349 [Thyridium curvatum]
MAGASGPPTLLDNLNAAQRLAVRSDRDTVAILAGPGSGKTHTLTSRVAWLIDHVGYKPEHVIVATFTVKAAREMKERIGKALGNGREKRIILGTFHSIARRYLAAYGQRIGLDQKFGIADDADSRAIIQRIIKRLQLTLDPPMARGWISKRKAKGTGDNAQAKPQFGGNQSQRTRELETCYAEYQSHLERSNLLDYDDLLVKCVELLTKFPSCVSNIQSVLIDEYQDTNGVQYELMRLFAQKHRRITIVGDPDQSIYGWRSAEIRNLFKLLQDYPGTDEISLEENYRSSSRILDVSLQVIQQDEKRYKKVLLPVHQKGTKPVLRKLRTSSIEAEWIVSEIRRSILMSGKMITHDDIAILLRSAFLSRHIETALGKAGIPYRMVGGFKFYERAEIKVILDYLRVIHQPNNNDSLARVINTPKRGVGEATIKALLEEAEKASMSLWDLLVKHCRGDRRANTNIKKNVENKLSGDFIRLILGIQKRVQEATPEKPFTLVEMIEQLLASLKFEKYLEDTYGEDHEGRWANVKEFLGLAKDFMKEAQDTEAEALPEVEGVDQVKEVEILPRFLANVSLSSDAQKTDEDQEQKPMITISTIHAAKGLEWPVVFVPSAYNGSIPHMRSEDSDEERRLLYVAMTRAKALLYLSCPQYSSHGHGEELELSPFLEPVPLHYFAERGPSFDRPVLEELGRILNRQVPLEADIYTSMPMLVSTEDDAFPIDPEDTYKVSSRDWNGSGGSSAGVSRPSKRQKLYGPAGSVDADDQPQWKRDYATTMEAASSFTVPSLPGFVSAGAHHTALAAAEPVPPEAPRQTGQKAPGKATTKRPANQQSMLSFVKGGSQPVPHPVQAPAPTPVQAPALPRPGVYHTVPSAGRAYIGGQNTMPPMSYNRPPPPTIQPEFTGHRLGGGRMMSRPQYPRSEPVQRNAYVQFTSSPPTSPSKTGAVVAQGDYTGVENAQNVQGVMRPAACLHQPTTYSMPPGLAGYKRPGGLSREGIAPMERLRKPFKPLTMNRPS